MFLFHDVPEKCPQAAGLHKASWEDANSDILMAWHPWKNSFPKLGLSKHSFVKAGTTSLARGLFIDSRSRMPLSECKSLLDAYIELQFGLLGSKQFVGKLPQHHKRIAAEMVSNAASVSAAQRCGYQFFANRRDLNVLLTNCWIKPWDGAGPDFLMSGPKGSAFLEIKGSTLSDNLSFSEFASNKAQSVNAELRPFGARVHTRHILSQVVAPPGEALSVHWFNADERGNTDLSPDKEAVVLIATGLAQFVGQIRNAGYDAGALLNGTFVLPDVARHGHGFFLAPQPYGEFRIGISYAALRLFVTISRFFLRLRAPGADFEQQQGGKAIRLAKQLTGLRSFFGAPDAAWRLLDEKPIYTYATGIFVLGPRENSSS